MRLRANGKKREGWRYFTAMPIGRLGDQPSEECGSIVERCVGENDLPGRPESLPPSGKPGMAGRLVTGLDALAAFSGFMPEGSGGGG